MCLATNGTSGCHVNGVDVGQSVLLICALILFELDHASYLKQITPSFKKKPGVMVSF